MNLPVLPNVRKLSPLVTRILGGNPGPFTLQGTNTYLIGHASSLILLDTAQGLPTFVPHLRTALESYANPVVTDIILSHWHHDHIGGLADVLALVGELKMPPPKVWKWSKQDDTELNEILSQLPPESSHLPPPSSASASASPLFYALSPGQAFLLDPTTPLEVLHTPGHTTDSISLFLPSQKILFTADTVLGHGTAVFEDLRAYLASLEACVERLAGEGDVKLCCGHGEVVEDGLRKLREYISHRRQREDEVLESLEAHRDVEGGVTALGITHRIYNNAIPETLIPAATRGVHLHLQKLHVEGRVDRIVASQDVALDAPIPGWHDSWKLVSQGRKL